MIFHQNAKTLIKQYHECNLQSLIQFIDMLNFSNYDLKSVIYKFLFKLKSIGKG